MWSALLVAYGTVLVAELVGDKTLYTLGALATRFRPAPILAGAAAAFTLKIAVAVLLGSLVADLPPMVVRVLSATTFFAMAVSFVINRPSKSEPDAAEKPLPRFPRAALVSFAAIFIPEWGDPGQLTAAALVAHGTPALVVWLGATLAMTTKAALGATVGMGLRRVAPQNVVRIASIVLCTAMGLLATFRIEL